jgi:benzoylformate decarboxylase
VTITLAAALLRWLAAQGVRHLFGNPGATEMPLLVALAQQREIAYVPTLHEAAACAMADAYARVTGTPGVLLVHNVAGFANALSGLVNAARDKVPLLVICGEAPTDTLVDEPLHSGDLPATAGAWCRYAHALRDPRALDKVLRRAWRAALTPPLGPALLVLPADLQSAPYSLPAVVAPLEPVSAPPAEPAAVLEAAARLNAAAEPIFLAGDRIGRTGALAEAVALAEKLGCPVYAAARTGVCFPTDHPQFAGLLDPSRPLRAQYGAHDLVLAAGADLFRQPDPTPTPVLDPSVPLLHLDDDPSAIGRTYEPAVAVYGQIGPTLAALRRNLAARARPATYRGPEFAYFLTEGPIQPRQLAGALREALPAGALLIDESVTLSAHLHAALTFRAANDLLSSKGGALGWGLPAAVGAALASPGRKVVAVIGDGAALYTPQALWTAARLALPITWVIVANRTYRVLERWLDRYQLPDPEAVLPLLHLHPPTIDFVSLARGLGIPARRIEDAAALPVALHQSFGDKGPALLEIIVQ